MDTKVTWVDDKTAIVTYTWMGSGTYMGQPFPRDDVCVDGVDRAQRQMGRRISPGDPDGATASAAEEEIVGNRVQGDCVMADTTP